MIMQLNPSYAYFLHRLTHDILHISPGIIPRPSYQPETHSDMGRGVITGTLLPIEYVLHVMV